MVFLSFELGFFEFECTKCDCNAYHIHKMFQFFLFQNVLEILELLMV